MPDSVEVTFGPFNSTRAAELRHRLSPRRHSFITGEGGDERSARWRSTFMVNGCVRHRIVTIESLFCNLRQRGCLYEDLSCTRTGPRGHSGPSIVRLAGFGRTY